MKRVITQQHAAYTPSCVRGLHRQFAVAVSGLLISLGAAAADYTQVSTEELVGMRSRIGVVSEQERNQYYKELRARMNNMSIGERMRLMHEADNTDAQTDAARQRYGSGVASPGFGYGYEKRQRQQGAGRNR